MISLSPMVRYCAFMLMVLAVGVVVLPDTVYSQQPSSEQSKRDQQAAAIAGNPEVAEILRNRSGRGVMADDSQPTPPAEALKLFRVREGLSIELVASEPSISQPLFLSWDSAGRLWVVQYRQYQYPAGLKVVRFDQHLRAVFDKTPAAPPHHTPGADVISVLEDQDRDGVYETQRDVISGLNIATSVAIGAGGIWVMNPPYLLFYPDQDGDAVPDGEPEVHLSGFGLQDTHSVANSLMFGPDGWLYGANGSTTSGTIISAGSPATSFEGQCIWRYHPTTKVFEIYAEGGGNTFSLEIDSVGRVFSGTNGGGTRGWYYPQGSYSQKNWGKHGPLTNPFAFGFLEAMKCEGDSRRFPQAFLIYEGGLLESDLNGCIIAPNSLHNLVWLSRRIADGSTFRTVDLPNLVETTDRWFRPVYAGAGPDGAVYLADWYDTRLSHVSPVDDWHKESGRIYRIAPAQAIVHAESSPFSGTSQRLLPTIDLTSLDGSRLVTCLTHSNKWVRQRAALEFGWRRDTSQDAQLIQLVTEQSNLDALWALSNLGQLDSSLAKQWLQHPSADIRRWVVRILGDQHNDLSDLAYLAANESNVEVRSQLAATAQRLSSSLAFQIVTGLLRHPEDLQDPDLPLMTWWAIEAHATDFEEMLKFVQQPVVWQSPMMQQFLAERISQRYAAAGTAIDMQRCAELLALPMEPNTRNRLVIGINKAFLGRTLPPNLPGAIQQALAEYRLQQGTDGIVQAANQGDLRAQQQLLTWLKDSQQDLTTRIEAARALGNKAFAPAKDLLLGLALGRGNVDPALQRVAIQSLTNYDDAAIASTLITAFDSTISGEHNLRDTACRTLASRPAWATVLLRELSEWRLRRQDVPADVVVQLRSMPEEQVMALVDEVFGAVQNTDSPAIAAEVRRLEELLSAIPDGTAPAVGDKSWTAGEQLFMDRCGKCHQLFGRGETIGPKLDSYDRGNLRFWLTAIVAPSIEIREGFQTYQLLTVDGRVLTGMIVAQDLNSISIRSADGQVQSVAAEDVEQLQALPVSLMPEGLLKDLSEQQLRDLFAYLRTVN